MYKFLLLSSILISLFALEANAATYLQVQGPVNGTLNNNGTIFLGKLGPGQSFYVQASASTDNASGSYVNIGWDTLTAINLPPGWSMEQSPLYQNPMKLKITASPYASDGTYNITIRAVNINNYSRLGNLTIHAYVNITRNVFTLSVSPSVVNAGIGQPTDLMVSINNTGISDDPFVINLEGLPAWNVSYEVVARHSAVSTFVYPVSVGEPGVYRVNLTAASATSPLINSSVPITIRAQASLFNDYYATGQGVVISPVIVEPAYSLMLLLSHIFSRL
ncbi:MAG: hypothetical protein QXF01_01365 [Candidatus Micrarchaeaceae archaeon]